MRILIVDDHPLMQEALSLVIQTFAPKTRLVVAEDLQAATATIKRSGEFDLALLDLGLPNCTGLEALTTLRTRFPDQAVVVVSGADDKETVLAALEAGAMGFIPKKYPRSILIGALRLVLEGGIYIPPHAVQLPEGSSKDVKEPPRPPREHPAQEAEMTPRQLETLGYLARGLSNKEIARRLGGLSESTVKSHVTGVLRAFHVDTRTQAIIKAQELGIRFPPSSG